MKNYLYFIIFILLPINAFSSPFGLKMGMMIDEIEAQCEESPDFIKSDIYLIKPINNHSLFEYYAVYVNEKIGLYQIRAISDSIETNKYGTELQNFFNNVKDRISKTYGNPKVVDKIDRNLPTAFQKDDYWFYTLKEGSRELYAIWGTNELLSDNLHSVVLECIPENGYGYKEGKGHLLLNYCFVNFDNVKDEEDSVF